MKTQRVNVNLKNTPYPIYIGQDLLTCRDVWIRHIVNQQVMIVTNETVAPLYLEKIKSTLHPLQCDSVILPDGERHKSMEQLNVVLDALVHHHHHRDTTVITLGGGVIGDMAGFAAACYQRGVAFIQTPTTLLSQVDASVGGKTAVNHPLGKNFIGAFHQPQAVIIDINTLATLPEREFKAGIAEIIKAALIRDADFFDFLEKNMPQLLKRDPDTILHAIRRSCEIKRDIVVADEKEIIGTRALLNLGHTYAHAIEQVLEYGHWLHGEAVAAGLVYAATLSQQKGWITSTDADRIKKLVTTADLPTAMPASIDAPALLSAMMMDKKVLSNQLHMVLLKKIGHGILTNDVTEAQVTQSIAG